MAIHGAQLSARQTSRPCCQVRRVRMHVQCALTMKPPAGAWPMRTKMRARRRTPRIPATRAMIRMWQAARGGASFQPAIAPAIGRSWAIRASRHADNRGSRCVRLRPRSGSRLRRRPRQARDPPRGVASQARGARARGGGRPEPAVRFRCRRWSASDGAHRGFTAAAPRHWLSDSVHPAAMVRTGTGALATKKSTSWSNSWRRSDSLARTSSSVARTPIRRAAYATADHCSLYFNAGDHFGAFVAHRPPR